MFIHSLTLPSTVTFYSSANRSLPLSIYRLTSSTRTMLYTFVHQQSTLLSAANFAYPQPLLIHQHSQSTICSLLRSSLTHFSLQRLRFGLPRPCLLIVPYSSFLTLIPNSSPASPSLVLLRPSLISPYEYQPFSLTPPRSFWLILPHFGHYSSRKPSTFLRKIPFVLPFSRGSRYNGF